MRKSSAEILLSSVRGDVLCNGWDVGTERMVVVFKLSRKVQSVMEKSPLKFSRDQCFQVQNVSSITQMAEKSV